MKIGKLYLIPTIISEGTQNKVIPQQVKEILPSLQYFFAENIRTARRYLSSLKVFESIEPLHFELLDKDTPSASLERMFAPLFAGNSIGVLSESGCPGVADPGALAVDYAHQHDVEVVPLVGPSSIMLALMSSGLNGQQFTFHGYLPVDTNDLTRVLKELEKESLKKNQTQLFIETPYRNNNMMKTLLKTLGQNTLLTVALDLTGENQSIKTSTIQRWRKVQPAFPKLPAVFLFLAR